MTGTTEPREYPNRAELVGNLLPLLKSARRPVPKEYIGLALNEDASRKCEIIAHSLAGHPHFEHLGREKIEDRLRRCALRYQATKATERSAPREVAAEILDSMAQEPLHGTVYLGVEHLKLPHGTVVAGVRFVDPTLDPDLAAAFAHFGDSAPRLVCEVENVTAGTPDLLRERARDTADIALALTRQHNLFGFRSKIYLDQILYGLDGTWTWRIGSVVSRAGWWRIKPTPLPMDLDHSNGHDWRRQLTNLSDHYSSLSPELRQRVDMCLSWLDVAALSDRWRVILPAIFSGLEALLVPETVGLKAAVVTVRSVAVHVALEHDFFDPVEIVAAYDVRNSLIHGTPLPKILEADASEAAEFRRLWAFRVFRDYLELAKSINATRVKDIVSYLDKGTCHDVCDWLEEYSASVIVKEYREAFPTSKSKN